MLSMLGGNHRTCSKVTPIALAFSRVVDQEIPCDASRDDAREQESPENVTIGLKSFDANAEGDENNCSREQQQPDDFHIQSPAPPADNQNMGRGACPDGR